MRPPAGPVGGLGGDREGSLRILISVLLVLLVALQYRLWFTDGGLLEVRRLHAAIAEQRERNAALRARNEALAAEVSDLKQGLDAIEARARAELGMVGADETFYWVVSPDDGRQDTRE